MCVCRVGFTRPQHPVVRHGATQISTVNEHSLKFGGLLSIIPRCDHVFFLSATVSSPCRVRFVAQQQQRQHKHWNIQTFPTSDFKRMQSCELQCNRPSTDSASDSGLKLNLWIISRKPASIKNKLVLFVCECVGEKYLNPFSYAHTWHLQPISVVRP